VSTSKVSPIAMTAAGHASLAGLPGKHLKWPGKTRRRFKPGDQIVRQGEPGGRAFVLDHGWTYSSVTLHNGSRQITDVQVQGDVANLQGLVLPSALFDLTAITAVDAFEISLDESSEDTPAPDYANALPRMLAKESAVIATRLASIGRRNALERTAHFYLELWFRLRPTGQSSDAGFSCPMTQYLIADALGLTPEHVNRVLRDLRTLGLASHQRGWFSLLDKDKLAGLAGFDSAYLEPVTVA